MPLVRVPSLRALLLLNGNMISNVVFLGVWLYVGGQCPFFLAICRWLYFPFSSKTSLKYAKALSIPYARLLLGFVKSCSSQFDLSNLQSRFPLKTCVPTLFLGWRRSLGAWLSLSRTVSGGRREACCLNLCPILDMFFYIFFVFSPGCVPECGFKAAEPG